MFNTKNTLGFIVTTSFNFFSITILLLVSIRFIQIPELATLAAQLVGLLVSMFFTLDIWWARISKVIQCPIVFQQRVKFLTIGSFTAIVAWLAVRITSKFEILSTFGIVLINWFVIGVIALFKYFLFVHVLQSKEVQD